MTGLESGVLQQLNAVRAEHGLPALRANAKLAAAADQHSREMADDGYFDHNSVDGTSFANRIAKWYPLASFHSWYVGENLLWSSPSVDPSGAVAMWMQIARSPRQHPEPPVPRDRHRRRLQHLGRRRVPAPAGHDHHDRLRRSPLTGVPFRGGRP